MPRSSRSRADAVAAIGLLFFALFVIAQARQLPSWHDHGPGPGFLPFWLGVLLAGAAVALLVGSRRTVAGMAATGGDVRLVVVVALSASLAALTYVTGMVLATACFMAAILFYFDPRRRALNALAAIVTPFVVWLIFVRWLNVPLPRGPFGF